MTDVDASRTSVVVGVGDSEHSRRALEWAAGEARRRGAGLRIVHALPLGPSASGGPDAHRAAADRSLTELAELASRLGSQPLTVTTQVVDGLPVKVLIDESRLGALLVLGSRGQGGFANLLLGSTAVEVTARAASPVVVVPPAADVLNPSGDVMVGVDGSHDEPALEFAFSRASQRQARLVALHVWDTERAEAESEAVLSRTLAPRLDQFPDVVVEMRSISGNVVTELAAASAARGEVIVVGGRGRSVLAGAFLGSVGQGLLRHATIPVVIAR